MTAPSSGRTETLVELARLFFKLGTVAFGGPAAHVAMMEDEVVRRRQWLTRDEFLDLLGATNLIPGPNSTEMAIHIGHRRAGWAGLVVAGTCFILPAAMIVTFVAWGYVEFGRLPQVGEAFGGVKPVIIAVVVQALWRLGRSAVKNRLLAVVGALAAVLCFAGLNELVVLFGAGFLLAMLHEIRRSRTSASGAGLMVAASSLPLPAAAGATIGTAAAFGLWPMFLFFLKVGSVLFGSGYVLLAFLRADLVDRWHWLSEGQLLDAVAVGQVTPGPVFTTATFIGYVLAGAPGATLATIGIFLPAFFFVAVSGPLVPRIRRSSLAGAFLDGVNVASLALMTVVTWQLGRAAIHDLFTLTLVATSSVLLFRFQTNSAWLVLGGALAGLLKSWLF